MGQEAFLPLLRSKEVFLNVRGTSRGDWEYGGYRAWHDGNGFPVLETVPCVPQLRQMNICNQLVPSGVQARETHPYNPNIYPIII